MPPTARRLQWMKRKPTEPLEVRMRTPKWSKVTFAQMRRFLQELGFQEVPREQGHRLEHEPSDTVLVFRPYRAAEMVYVRDLHLVRSQLDWRGLMVAELFGQSLEKTPA